MQIPESLKLEKESADKIWDIVYSEYLAGRSSKDELNWAMTKLLNTDKTIFKHEMEEYFERRNAERAGTDEKSS